MSGAGHGYAVRCPYCDDALVEVAKRFWTIRGLVLALRYGSVTAVGCKTCVQHEGRRHLLRNLGLGWWSVLGPALTPLILLQNGLELVSTSSTEAVESALAKAGLDVEEVRFDERGFTGEQRRLLDAAYAVLGQIIKADGRVLTAEVDLAASIIGQLSGGKIGRSEAIDAVLLSDVSALSDDGLSLEYRLMLLAMAVDAAVSDGTLSGVELGWLRTISDTLELDTDHVDRLLDERRVHQERATTSGDRHPREVRRALEILGLSTAKDLRAIKTAYRRCMLRHHPDRAGTDEDRRRAHHHMALQINHAYDVLLRYAGAR